MSEAKGKVILLSSEGCGNGDEDLGYEILSALLKTLPERKDEPTTIVCWNTAVRLLAKGSPFVPHLARLEENGVSILAGKLCVADLGLTDRIAVGKVAT